MDPLDVLMNKEKVIPYFQPIISADKQEVVGYEVLARIMTSQGVKSLGWFFHDESIPYEYQEEIEDHIQTLALEYYINHDLEQFLCLNINIQSLLKDDGERLFTKLRAYESKGLFFEKIVLEIQESDYVENYNNIKHLLVYIQNTGVRISIGGIDNATTNLERMAVLKPSIVKVNVGFIEGDAFPELYRDVLHSLSSLTRKLGATLLFEKIDTYQKLNFAWKNGGRYYQGYYLSVPKAEFIEADFCKHSIRKEFHHFINYERKKIESQLSLTETVGLRLKATLKAVKSYGDFDAAVLSIAKALTDLTFRVYICDHDGFQQSSNAVKTENGDWTLEKESRSKNWSWRPYFLENIVRMNYEKKGLLSDLYTDIEKDEMIRTYSYPIGEQLFLFIDIPYSYLYEKDGLL
ncbi:EAL-associated domain-containing protein [Alkalihalobacillus sp. LMS39]|uniref:EAL domain-containing protein n=1 Tax=Alkalihalobacillus sp. LMS39 TaxID=2924032 RepID=UPI001FB405BC|nr:EAL-associated domain-containing protein [Alkalihalobacillus sp. LMS39]UOE92628.1 EAL domain-containing protein [Alkalihalobacillus sp. LMS39]